MSAPIMPETAAAVGTHERTSPTTVRITWDRPVTRDVAEAYCEAHRFFGYHPAGYGGFVLLDYRDCEQTPGEDWRATTARYTHSLSCD